VEAQFRNIYNVPQDLASWLRDAIDNFDALRPTLLVLLQCAHEGVPRPLDARGRGATVRELRALEQWAARHGWRLVVQDVYGIW
jgi:hypothetical protein